MQGRNYKAEKSSFFSSSIIFNQNTFFAQHYTSYIAKEIEVEISIFPLQSSCLQCKADKGSIGDGAQNVEQTAGGLAVNPKDLNLFFFLIIADTLPNKEQDLNNH